MLNILVPSYLSEVSTYIFDLIFIEFWGLDIQVNIHEENCYVISNLENHLSVTIPCHFIQSEKNSWLQSRSGSSWRYREISVLEEEMLPVFFENFKSDVNLDTEIDFPGTIFFLINRYHEYVENLGRDRHNRIEAKDTLLIKNELINTPVADRYLRVFKDFICHKIEIKINKSDQFNILPSHDVDRPFEYLYYTPQHLIKRLGGDLLVRKSVQKAFLRARYYTQAKSGQLQYDPYDTFDWIMEVSEKFNLTSTFHFITEATNSKFDQDYHIESEEITNLINKIHGREHQIALHPSYDSTEQKTQIQKEFSILKGVCNDLGIEQEFWKSRNHYLRWNTDTISELETSGIDVDQTLGFAQKPGFRCSTCRSFTTFNFQTMKASSFKIEPLILMEQSLISNQYLGLRKDLGEAWNIVNALKSECKKYNGNFTILWHNNHLDSVELKEFYQECLK